MKVGDRVQVCASINVYHHPEHRNQAVDIKDMQGEIIHIITDYKGRSISPNYPFEVQLTEKFKVHLNSHELEVVS